jgi:hypothetical protein
MIMLNKFMDICIIFNKKKCINKHVLCINIFIDAIKIIFIFIDYHQILDIH